MRIMFNDGKNIMNTDYIWIKEVIPFGLRKAYEIRALYRGIQDMECYETIKEFKDLESAKRIMNEILSKGEEGFTIL